MRFSVARLSGRGFFSGSADEAGSGVSEAEDESAGLASTGLPLRSARRASRKALTSFDATACSTAVVATGGASGVADEATGWASVLIGCLLCSKTQAPKEKGARQPANVAEPTSALESLDAFCLLTKGWPP